MYNNKIISLIVPCYNEEKGIEGILGNKPSFIDEVIVVDNDSHDKTGGVARKYGATVIHLRKRGYGLAYQKGLSAASGDIIIMLDGDGTYPLSNTGRFLAYIEKGGYDFVTACRFPLADKKAMPFIKRISNYLISWLIRRLFNVKLTDSQSGMFVFRRQLLDKIVSSNTGMGFSQELKLRSWLNPDIRSRELHVNYQKRIGKVKYRPIRDGLSNIYGMLIFLRSYKKEGLLNKQII